MCIQVPISYNLYSLNENREKAYTGLNKDFIDYIVLINALIRLEPNGRNNHELISYFKKEYKGNKNQLRMIDEFNERYTPDTVLWWYTRDSFFYKILNRTLCLTQNYFDLLLLFRSYLKDIYEQLKQNQCQSAIRVYFSQGMWGNEITFLQDPKTQYISMKSFLWANTSRDKTLNSINKSFINDGQKQVLFIIDADPTIGRTRPFANISQISHSIDEGEVLFMVGCIFRIHSVIEEGDIISVQIKLCAQNADDIQDIYGSMCKIHNDQNNDDQISLQKFADILYRMGNYNCAETIYTYALHNSSSNDSLRSEINFSLGLVEKERRSFDSSLKFYQKALDIEKGKKRPDYNMIGKLYACMGEVHQLEKKHHDAIKSFKKAIETYEKNHVENYSYLADFYYNIGSIHKQIHDYVKALEFYRKALELGEQHLSSNPLNIAKAHSSLGTIYYLLNQYDQALMHHQNSLAIKCSITPIEQDSIAKSYINIAAVYKAKNNLNEASIYYRKASAINQNMLPIQPSDRIEIDDEIRSISDRMR